MKGRIFPSLTKAYTDSEGHSRNTDVGLRGSWGGGIGMLVRDSGKIPDKCFKRKISKSSQSMQQKILSFHSNQLKTSIS